MMKISEDIITQQ